MVVCFCDDHPVWKCWGYNSPRRPTEHLNDPKFSASFSAQVICVDINSGTNGDTGEGGLIFHSDLTVTIGFVKNGLVAPNAGNYMKRLVCADIGIRLAEEKNKICGVGEHHPDAIPCPPWLDTNVIKSFDK